MRRPYAGSSARRIGDDSLAETKQIPTQRMSSVSSGARRSGEPHGMKAAGTFFLVVGIICFVVLILYLVKLSMRSGPDRPAAVTTAAVTTVGIPTDPVVTDPVVTRPVVTEPVVTEPIVIPEDTVLHFAAAGDVLIHECVYLDAADLGQAVGVEYDFTTQMAGIRSLIENTDLAFANMECSIAGDEYGIRGYPYFNAPTAVGDALIGLGFNVINIANNHMLDMDKITTGYKNSYDYWKSKEILMIGGYESEEDYNTVRKVTVNGITVAFLAYTYGPEQSRVSADSPYMIVPLVDTKTNTDVLVRQITAAKAEADLVFVSMHWGKDSAEAITTEQIRLAQIIADAGADLIIGTHSHTVQPMDWLTGKSGNRTLCIYSLGNFISTQLEKKLILENIVTLDIVKSGADGSVSLRNVVANPVVCHYETDTSRLDGQGFSLRYNVRLYRLDDYTAELCKLHGAHLAYGDYKTKTETFSLATLKESFTKVISQEFLPTWMK